MDENKDSLKHPKKFHPKMLCISMADHKKNLPDKPDRPINI